MDFPDAMYLNFASMHGIQSVMSDISRLALTQISIASRPPLSWFESILNMDSPETLTPRELPFRSYLITGNAGSGKSTCIQTLHENLNCIITGSTRIASLNVFHKLASTYTSQRIPTIFQEFGFKGNHIQIQLGRFVYRLPTDPISISDIQMRDIWYYWDVLRDITREILTSEHVVASTLRRFKERLGCDLSDMLHIIAPSTPSFARSNIIVIDEAGVLSRYVLTAVVYVWWLVNSAWHTTSYTKLRVPVIVCVGSPTQTNSMETTFEHSSQRQIVSSSVNILSHIICTPVISSYIDLVHNWAIFINNKRCTEPRFSNMLKAFEFGLEMDEDHANYLDQFVVPESHIRDPTKFPGWTRLFTSHDDVRSYMTKLHADLRTNKTDHFLVFGMPVYTIVNLSSFEQYTKLSGNPELTLQKWLTTNKCRLYNYSQSRDHDITQPRFESYTTESGVKVALVQHEVTHVLNSQVSVTTKARKWLFGFEGTFESFVTVLTGDTFFKKHGEGQVEYAFRFISTLLFSGMIEFYEFLRRDGLPKKRVDEAYDRLYEMNERLNIHSEASKNSFTLSKFPMESTIDASNSMVQLTSSHDTHDMYIFASDECETSTADTRDLFGSFDDKSIDGFYLTCNFRPGEQQGAEIYTCFDFLKRIFLQRYNIFTTLFGESFLKADFKSFVGNVAFRGHTVMASSFKGGLSSMAVQTDIYTLRGTTTTHIQAFSDDMMRRKNKDLLGVVQDARLPYVVVRDQLGFVSALALNIADFVDRIANEELYLATTIDHGLSSNLAMTITRSQGLSLERVAICFNDPVKLNTAYVAISRVTNSKYLRMNINPLRTKYEDTREISEYIIRALRTPSVRLIY
ncbi:helicase-primase helicase subunit [Psittacid alphaherpesvirus 5]|nr:helicase-primase helicase subunit [Psittacid alphaherpesvirus 5]